MHRLIIALIAAGIALFFLFLSFEFSPIVSALLVCAFFVIGIVVGRTTK